MGVKSRRKKPPRRQPSTIRGFLLGVAVTLTIVGVAWWTFTPSEIRNRQIESARDLISGQVERARERIPAPKTEDSATYTWSDDSTFVFAGTPKPSGYPNPVTVLENTGFTVGYCDHLRNPVWVSYRIHREDQARAPPRPSRFSVDDRTGARVRHEDYTSTGFDRGHMAPNHAIGSRYGREAQMQTFLMSNVAPQTPNLNQKTWRLLEERIANEYTRRYGDVWVMVGPIFDEPPKRMKSGVAIPDAFYKVIVAIDGDRPKAISFIFPQAVTGKEPFESYLTSIAVIQARTGFDFFWQLEDDFETAFEAATAEALW
jgi:endonuclease G